MIKISVSEEVQDHLKSHFQKGTIGSKFIKDSWEEVLFDAMHLFIDKFRQMSPDQDGRIRLSLCFPYTIGYSNVVSMEQLTKEERESVRLEDRNDISVKVIDSNHLIPTAELQLVLSKDIHLITMFPGELAPPLPLSKTEPSPYWDNHVFIKPI